MSPLRSLRRNAALAAARVPKALEALRCCRACVRDLYNSVVYRIFHTFRGYTPERGAGACFLAVASRRHAATPTGPVLDEHLTSSLRDRRLSAELVCYYAHRRSAF